MPRIWHFVAAFLLPAHLVHAETALAELSRMLPDGAIVAYAVTGPRRPEPPPATGDQAPASVWSGRISLLEQAQRLGLLSVMDSCTRQWLDALGAIGMVFEYPHAAALVDISAVPRSDGGHQLGKVGAVLVVDAKGDDPRFARRIQHLLDTYTNSEHSTLSTARVGEVEWSRLRDHRLPEWFVLCWGKVGDYYIVTVGDRAFDRMLALLNDDGPRLAANSWYTSALRRVEYDNTSFVLYADFAELHRRLDADLGRKIRKVQTAFRLADVSRGLWVARRSRRALEMRGCLRRGQRDVEQVIAARSFADRLKDPVIPEQATRFAVFEGRPRRICRGIAEAYLSARSPGAAEKSRAFWRGLQEKSGVSIESDILARLGEIIVLHDHPRPVIDIPVARTIVVSIDREPDLLRQHIDEILTYLRDVLIPPGLFQLRRADDGVWYMQYGLNGPAMAVLDRWLVVAFTPTAVREVCQQLEPAPPALATQPPKPSP